MKTKMLSERKREESRRKFLCSKFMSGLVMTLIISTFMCISCFAAEGSAASGGDAINTAKNLLSKAATAGGGLWAVWGLVTLGMAIKDHNGPGIGGAVWQIVGGAISLSRTHKNPAFKPLFSTLKSI